MSNYAYLKCVFPFTLSFIFAMSASILAAQSTPAIPAVQTTPMIGLADGQLARLNLLNPGVLAPATGVICSAAVSFVDAGGTVLKTGSLSIPPGKSMAFDLLSNVDLGLAYSDRREIRALVATPAATPVATSSTAAAPACKLISTLEIFDSATGRTLVVVGRLETIPSVVTAN
jgi:hypothetical protein